MAYLVDRVVICDAYAEPDRHYQLLPGGRSRLVEARRPSQRWLATTQQAKKGIAGVIGQDTGLFDDTWASEVTPNEFVNALREEVGEWRRGEGQWAGRPYDETAMVTRRLLEWWFEREEERQAEHQRFFFCQREAIETVIYLYEVKGRHRMPETGDLLRYGLKLATGTGKTVVMALLIVWSTLHSRKVSNSSLTSNFLVLVPNLTVLDRVSGATRGDGLDPGGAENLYAAFDMVPPEYADVFQPKVLVKNWQAIPLEARRDDWIPEGLADEGRFVPASVLWALQRRAKQDPNAAIRKLLGNLRDVMIINDEAHYVYGEKRAKKGEEPDHIRWSHIIMRIGQVARISLVADLSATPWYGSGSPKPEGTLFEWLVSDFSVYDAFESGLVKVVRLPDPEGPGAQYLDLWENVKGARTKEEFLAAGKGAVASIYSGWSAEYQEWQGTFEEMRLGPAPVLLVVADKAERAQWLFEHLTHDYPLLRNPDDEDPSSWVTIRVDSQVFKAEKGREAILRSMVNTVGRKGQPGEAVRCIVCVDMLSEGWDVKSVTHILGLRAFGSPLLTEQIIGRGLRRMNYDLLNQPLAERPDGADETVDAFGIPFIGFPVEKRKRPRTGHWNEKPVWIEAADSKSKFRLRVPNVRSWAVGITRPLAELVRIDHLPPIPLNPKETPPEVTVRPVVGGNPEAVMTLASFREQYPLLRTALMTAAELYERTNPGSAGDLGVGPTFDELLDVVQAYLARRVTAEPTNDLRDVGIYYWRMRMLDILENAVRSTVDAGARAIPILGTPEYLESGSLRRFQWTGLTASGKKCHTSKVPCHVPLEREFADFMDGAGDVLRYFKNERFGFSITYYENNRPRQYYPDFIVAVGGSKGEPTYWLAETKGEIRPNTALKRQAAEAWCDKMSSTNYGSWRYLFVPQVRFERAMSGGVYTFAQLVEALGDTVPEKALAVAP